MRITRITAAALAAVLAVALPATPAAAGAAEVPAAFTFLGAGWGHGVGMSQWGAYGMAKEGNSYDQIIGHYFPGTALTPMSTLGDTGLNTIRVGIMQDGTSIQLYGRALASSGGGSLDVSLDGAAPLVFAPDTKVTISLASGKARVVSGTTSATATQVTVRWNDTSANTGKASYIDFSGTYTKSDGTTGSVAHAYRYGFLDVRAAELAGDGRADLNAVIQQRLTDEYVKGISEVSNSWFPEALKAQTVAARSYALASIISINNSSSGVALSGFPKKVRASCLCQLLTGTSDQVYRGYDKETDYLGSNWTDAVNATAPGGDGQIVTSGSTVVKTFFASSTGGKTQPVAEVWGSAAPWLVTVDDHWSLDAPNPNAAWSKTVTQATLVSSVNAALAKSYTTAASNGVTCAKLQVADIAALSATGHYDSGGVSELSFADSAGNVTTVTVAPGTGCDRISPDRLRAVLGVKSTYISAVTPSSEMLDPTGAVVRAIRKVSVTKWPTRLVNPTQYTFTGGLTPRQFAAGVRLREKVNGSWTTVASTTTSLTGRYELIWTAPAIGQHRLKVVASNSKGSKATTMHVVAVVGVLTLDAPNPVPHGTPLALSGATTPVTSGAAVIIERRRFGVWRRVAVTTTAADGTWSYIVSTGSSATSLKLRVRTTDPRLGRVTSTSRTVAIT